MSRTLAALALLLAGLTLGSPAGAANISEVFLMLPNNECGGYGVEERKMMLEATIPAPGNAGRSPAPDSLYPWAEILSPHYLILHRPGYDDISYKLFDGPSFQLLASCRGRQRISPIDSSCRFNLCLFRLDRSGLTRVEQREYMPSISILDFIAVDTLMDPRAVKDIAERAPAYGQCLTCNASAQDLLALDIVTTTTVNAGACNNFLPTFGLLPLTWNGLGFTKPYDRAAPAPAPPAYAPAPGQN